MTGTATYDIEGTRITSGVSGDVYSRRYVINGLTGGPSVPALMSEAYAVLPDTGTPAPFPLVNKFIRDTSIDRIWCEDNSGTSWACEGTLTYTTPTSFGGVIGEPDDNGPGVTLSTATSVQEIDVYYNLAGAQLTTTNDNAIQAHRVQGFAVSSTFTFTRIESSNPRDRINTYVGKLNEFGWNGYGARFVLCSGINVTSDDGGVSYVTEYTFEFQAQGWDAVLIHDDPFFPGNPIPLSVADGTAISLEKVVPDVDFSGLNITL